MANAGHLPFLHRDAAGNVRTVTLPPAPPLGLLIGGFTEGELDVRPGDTLALFTDGLVESRTQDLDSGVAQLARAFADVGADDDLERIADALLHAMGRHEGEGADDLTLLVLRVTG
jgi:serine phosphatase RsbU (regulator of sigma subunit)